ALPGRDAGLALEDLLDERVPGIAIVAAAFPARTLGATALTNIDGLHFGLRHFFWLPWTSRLNNRMTIQGWTVLSKTKRRVFALAKASKFVLSTILCVSIGWPVAAAEKPAAPVPKRFPTAAARPDTDRILAARRAADEGRSEDAAKKLLGMIEDEKDRERR